MANDTFALHRGAVTPYVPAEVVQGSNDTMFPTPQSVLLFEHLPDAQLSLYPDAGHGSLFQHAALFVEQVNFFLRTH